MDNSFEHIYDNMTNNRGYLDSMISSVYDDFKGNPTDEYLKQILEGLVNVYKGMLSTQAEFTSSYADPSIKENMVSSLQDKLNDLEKFSNQISSRTK